jgi:hypothetical protein
MKMRCENIQSNTNPDKNVPSTQRLTIHNNTNFYPCKDFLMNFLIIIIFNLGGGNDGS